ncbi:GTPase IMAP family member 8-like isoform X2 [Cololabis saira]|uniref:GTPase IMAP family member 8-like isoform X2 n=1 Tax=Cololabis saira TaxID=129043 RepID=UPI002AD46668|nr:GTPase IMAP family member 8-like isoform X2 [Cololabis saira]
MENIQEEAESATTSEIRVILIGGRWAGKSSSANTILGKARFECGRTRTTGAEVRHEVVEGRKLSVVDTPGWRGSLSIAEIPEGEKLRFKLHASKCLPGPNVFLIVIPIDSAFSGELRATVEEQMKLLGDRAWQFTMLLFTYGDFLGVKTIEQHIESEGEALKWVVERCENRYHVFNNKDKGNSSQVSQLLEKIDEMVWNNNSSYYRVDRHTLKIITEKQQVVAERAKERQKKAEEQRRHMATQIPDMKPITNLQMILLGSRSVGKTSVGNTILGFEGQKSGKRTEQSVVQKGFVGKTEVKVVDTPGWWKGFPESETPQVIKDEVMRSMFLCPPGPHVFLLVIDADACFNAKHLDAVTTHMELLGEGVWKHTIIVFTRGDWLGTHTIEEYIEGEGHALQSLVEKCGNRYHVLADTTVNEGSQVTELLEKITEIVAVNGWDHFVPDEQIFETIEERQRKVEQGAMMRQSQVEAKRRSLKGFRKKLEELRIVMLGQKMFGKSLTGNVTLCKKVFSTSEHCRVEVGQVAGRLVTVIDTPGWWKDSSYCTEQTDREIVQGLSLSPLGVHAVLLVVPLDLTFGETQRVALEEHVNLFDDKVWKHTMVLFTHGDKLAEKSVEEHIERNHPALCWLVEKCDNKYHTMNNMKMSDMNQITELFEKIEEMVTGNRGQVFCPDMTTTNLRMYEKIRRRQLKHVLKHRLEEEYRRREVELMRDFRETLVDLQTDIGQRVTSTKPKSIGEYYGELEIKKEVQRLDKEIMKSSNYLSGSMEDLRPDLTEETPGPAITASDQMKSTSNFVQVVNWLSNLS